MTILGYAEKVSRKEWRWRLWRPRREQWWGYHISMSARMWAGRVDEHLHGSHIVESVVQLLADGFVLQFLSVQLVYDQEVEGRGARAWRVIKRWKVSEGGTGAIPTQQQGKGNAWRKWCRSRWPMQEACVLFLNELKQKTKRTKPIRKQNKNDAIWKIITNTVGISVNHG